MVDYARQTSIHTQTQANSFLFFIFLLPDDLLIPSYYCSATYGKHFLELIPRHNGLVMRRRCKSCYKMGFKNKKVKTICNACAIPYCNSCFTFHHSSSVKLENY